MGSFTRLIGELIMTHGDDDGLIVPPRLAPSHVVILPMIHEESTAGNVIEYCESLAAELRDVMFDGRRIVVEVDKREGRGGEKVWSWIKKGIPLYLEIGPRDIASDSVFVGRRDKSRKERYSQKRSEFVAGISSLLQEIQNNLFQRAKAYRDSHIRRIDSRDEFYEFLLLQPGEAGDPWRVRIQSLEWF